MRVLRLCASAPWPPRLPLAVFPAAADRPNPDADVSRLCGKGIGPIDALRLLLLCDWVVERALLVLETCQMGDLDPVRFAKEHTRRKR